MSELRIDKIPAQVSLITTSGEALSGSIFLSSYHPLRSGREEPEDVLNAPQGYFPLLTDDGVVIVAKEAIAELSYEREGEPQDHGTTPLGVTVMLSVTMSSGKNFSGDLWVEGPVNTPRLLDFMNRNTSSGERFLALHSDGEVRLLNKRHIETIRALD